MTDTPWLSPEEREAWMALAGVLFVLPTALDSQLQRDDGLAMADYMVLAHLSENPGQCLRMSDLAASAGTSQSRLSRIVARLESAGYVSRAMAADDRRAVLASLTAAGLAKIEAAAPGHVRMVRALVFDRLSPEQVRSLAGIGQSLLGDSCAEPSEGECDALALDPDPDQVGERR